MTNQSNYPFPNDNIDPIEKGKNSFGIKVSDAIYHNGVKTANSTSYIDRIKENRDFASNNQSVDKYKPILNAALDQKGDYSAMNIDWTISTPCQKFTNNLIGSISNQDQKIQFNAISPYSKTKYDADRDAYFQKMIMQKALANAEMQTGVALTDKSGFNPKDSEEIDLYMSMEYRQPVEIGMEEIVDFELYNNDYELKIKNRIIRDLVENHKGAARIYFDSNDKIRLRYTDIANYYSTFSTELDNNDVDYEAELIYLTIRELRKRDSNKSIKESDWKEIAKANSSKYGNPYFDNNSYGDSFYYDDYRIPVLDFIWYTTDKSYWENTVKPNGREYLDKRAFGYTSDKNNVIVKEREVSYEGLRIIGTPFILGYSLSKNMLRHKDNHNSEKLSPKLIRRYITFNIPGKSPVEVMKPNINNIQLLVLRKRHIIAEINPTGIAIDINGLTDVMSLMKMENPRELIQLYKQKGMMLYSRVDVNGDPTNGMPIQELGSNFANLLLSLDQSILSEINIIRENLGFSEVRDGSAPDKDALVGIEKLRLLSSSNTTRELFNGYTNGIFAQLGKVISRMVQYKIVYGQDGLKEYENVIGQQGVNSLEFAKDVEMSELGIKIEALPTAEEIQDLINSLNVAVQSGEIKSEDSFEIKRIMNIKKAIKFLTQRKKKYAEEKMLEFQQKEQITAEREKASAMAAAEAEKIKQQAKAEAETMIEEAKMRLNKEFTSFETMEKIKLIDRENYWKMKLIETAQEDDKDSQDEGKESEGLDAANTVRVFSNPERAATRTDQFTS